MPASLHVFTPSTREASAARRLRSNPLLNNYGQQFPFPDEFSEQYAHARARGCLTPCPIPAGASWGILARSKATLVGEWMANRNGRVARHSSTQFRASMKTLDFFVPTFVPSGGLLAFVSGNEQE